MRLHHCLKVIVEPTLELHKRFRSQGLDLALNRPAENGLVFFDAFAKRLLQNGLRVGKEKLQLLIEFLLVGLEPSFRELLKLLDALGPGKTVAQLVDKECKAPDKYDH